MAVLILMLRFLYRSSSHIWLRLWKRLACIRRPARFKASSLRIAQVRYGLSGEAAGSAISSLIGGFTTTAYPQNVALLKVTDEGKSHTRVPVIIAGVVFVALGFVPKAGAMLSLIPSPVIGGIFLPAAASLIRYGLQYTAQGRARTTDPK